MTASTPRRIPLRAWSSQTGDMTDLGSILAAGVAQQRAADPAMDSAEGCAGDDCECSLTVTHAGYFWLVYAIVCAAAVAAVFA